MELSYTLVPPIESVHDKFKKMKEKDPNILDKWVEEEARLWKRSGIPFKDVVDYIKSDTERVDAIVRNKVYPLTDDEYYSLFRLHSPGYVPNKETGWHRGLTTTELDKKIWSEFHTKYANHLLVNREIRDRKMEFLYSWKCLNLHND